MDIDTLVEDFEYLPYRESMFMRHKRKSNFYCKKHERNSTIIKAQKILFGSINDDYDIAIDKIRELLRNNSFTLGDFLDQWMVERNIARRQVNRFYKDESGILRYIEPNRRSRKLKGKKRTQKRKNTITKHKYFLFNKKLYDEKNIRFLLLGIKGRLRL